MGRLLQTQNRLYSLKKYKTQDFLHGCGRRQGCKLVWKSPTHLSLLPHEDFGKPVLVEELISLELIFVGGKQKFPFSFFALLLLFLPVNSNLWPPLFCCLWTVSCCFYPHCSNHCSLAGHGLWLAGELQAVSRAILITVSSSWIHRVNFLVRIHLSGQQMKLLVLHPSNLLQTSVQILMYFKWGSLVNFLIPTVRRALIKADTSSTSRPSQQAATHGAWNSWARG